MSAPRCCARFATGASSSSRSGSRWSCTSSSRHRPATSTIFSTAAERSIGWNRQLRLTPLRPGWYLSAKVLTGYFTAGITLLVLFASGVILGVRMPAIEWLETLGLMLVGLLPFAAIGVLAGHLLTADSMGPVIGGLSALLAFVGGTWFPLDHGSFLYEVGRELPSYWLVQASHVGAGGEAWGALGWGVVLAWSALFGLLAARVYRRDTRRV